MTATSDGESTIENELNDYEEMAGNGGSRNVVMALEALSRTIERRLSYAAVAVFNETAMMANRGMYDQR